MRVTTFARIGFGVGCTDEESTKNRRKSDEASDWQRIRLAPNPESRYYARSFWGAPPNARLAMFSAPSAPVPTNAPIVAIEDSRTWQTLPKRANVPGKRK